MKIPHTTLLAFLIACSVIFIFSCTVQEKQTSLEDAEKTIDVTCVTPPKLEDVDVTPAEREHTSDDSSSKTATKNEEEVNTDEVKKVATVSTKEVAERMSDKTDIAYMTGPITYELSSPTAMPGTPTPSTVPLAAITSTTSRSSTHSHDEPLIYKEHKDVTVTGAKPSSSASSAAVINSALAGQLTAGEINDFQKWKMWEDIADNELQAYRKIWKVNPSERYTVIAQNNQGAPIIDCTVELISKNGEVTWRAHTDNTGKAELWNQFDTENKNKNAEHIRVIHDNDEYQIKHPKTIENGTNIIKIESKCDIPDNFDLLFTVDATGSMGDEISYLQAELVDVVSKIKTNHKEINLRLGSVFYRDHGDTYLTVNAPFSEDVSETNQFIANQYADGGGDGPEAVDAALITSLDEMKWSDRARARLMFLILDAPPHAEKENTDKIIAYTKKFASKGIRIIPLVASGGGYDADKSLEYLMRSCALATNGTYGFLTDHSGIGGTHTAPSTDKYNVEKLNAMLVRIIDQFLFAPACNVDQFVQEQEPIDTSIVQENYEGELTNVDSTASQLHTTTPSIFILKCYPNPATDHIWVETSELVAELYLADNSGKIIQQLKPTSTLIHVDLTNYPTGVYHLKAWINEKWASARIVVTKI